MNSPAKKTTPWVVFRWTLGYALRRFKALAGVVASIVAHAILDVLKPWPVVFLVDYVLAGKAAPTTLTWAYSLPGGNDPMNLVVWALAATAALFVLSWAVGLAGEYPSIALGQGMTNDLARDLFAKLQQLPVRFHARLAIGDALSRVTSDCNCAANIIKGAALPSFWSCATLLLVIGILLSISPALAVMALIVIPFMLIVIRQYSEPIRTGGELQQRAEGRMHAVVEETLVAMPVVQGFCRESEAAQKLTEASSNSLRIARFTTSVQIRFNFFLGLTTAVATAGIYWLAGRPAQADLSAGSVILFLSYLGALYTPLQTVMKTSSAVYGAMGSAQRVREILFAENEVADEPNAPDLCVSGGALQFENVSFSYESGHPALRAIHLSIAPGQRVAIVGPSGAGKSTLANLIPRFFDPTVGRVLIDGQDLKKVNIKSIRESVAIVPQDLYLFPTSLAQNIGLGNSAATASEIEAAARAACAHEFIVKLPQGYQTIIGEAGATLSGGERQRIALARAFLKQAPILILDEPTSALDSQTERELVDAINRLSAGKTTLIIAHRLSTIRGADRVLVIVDGAIAEDGSPAELAAGGGIYAGFQTIQARGAAQFSAENAISI